MWLFVLSCSLLWTNVASQPMGFANQPEEKAPVVKSDLKFIACQSCEVLIREADKWVQRMKMEAKPGKKVTEADIFGYLEKMCDPDTDEGEWIAMIDLVESNAELKLVDMDMVGFCGTECRTIARACSDLIEEIDYDLTEALFKGEEDRLTLQRRFCREISSVCTKKPPKLPADRPEGPPFVAMTEEDYKMAKMMQQMKQMGLGGRVFDQDSAQRYIEEHSGALEDEDEDDDGTDGVDNEEMPSKRHSWSEMLQWAQQEVGKKLTSGIESAQNLYDRWTERFRKGKGEL